MKSSGQNDSTRIAGDQHELRQEQLQRRLPTLRMRRLGDAEEDGMAKAEHVEKADEGREDAECGEPVPALVDHGAEQQPFAAEAGQRRQARTSRRAR